MKLNNFRNLGLCGICAFGMVAAAIAGAQTPRHDVMDAHAAKMDIIRLKADMANARLHHNWGKVRQDKRLIAADRHFIKKDWHKVARATGA